MINEIDNLGCEINLDEGQGTIVSAKLGDDIRSVCSTLEIEFSCNDKLTFSNSQSNYITYDGIDWVPAVVSEVQNAEGTWVYCIAGYPRQIHVPIRKTCLDTNTLAISMGLTLSPDSENLPIKCPIINIYSGQLIQEVRKQSFDDAYNNMNFGDAYFIYIGSQYMYSTTWNTLINASVGLEITDAVPILKGQNITKHVQDRIMTDFRCTQNPAPWNQNDYLHKMMIDKFDYISPSPIYFAKMYTMKFTNTSELDSNKKYLCVNISRDVNKTNGCTATFADIALN